MKTLGRPESFSKYVQNFFKQLFKKKEDERLLVTALQHFHKSLIIVKYHVASKFFTIELTHVTSQDYFININDPWKYY